MPTKLKRLFSYKSFPLIFNILLTINIIFLANRVDFFVKTLFGLESTYGIIYIVSAIMFAKYLFDNYHEKSGKKEKEKKATSRRVIGYRDVFLLYFLIYVFVWTIICLLFSISDMTNAIGIICTILMSVLTVVVGNKRARRIVVKEYNVDIGLAKSKYRIALVSDIHLGVFVQYEHLKNMVKKINATSPDLVLIAGDIFDVGNDILSDNNLLKQLGKCLSKIKSVEGVYAVLGNHDPKFESEKMQKFAKRANIKLLNNECVELPKLNLIGRTDRFNGERLELKTLLPTNDKGKPVVVIDHNPDGIDEATENKVDLILCGHTHKGQLFPINVITKACHGKRNFYGMYKTDKTYSIVTSGAGYFALPCRIGSNSEIVKINLNL